MISLPESFPNRNRLIVWLCLLQVVHAFRFCFVPGHAEKDDLVSGCRVCVKRALRHLVGNQCPFKDHSAISNDLFCFLARHRLGSRLISPPAIKQVAERIFRRLHASFLQEQWAHPSSLHLVGFAFAVENVSRFSDAFAFALLRLFATADVGAGHVAAGNFLFGRSDRFFLDLGHFQVSLGHVGGNTKLRIGLFYSRRLHVKTSIILGISDGQVHLSTGRS